jgi:lipoyl(octanoyl) transferase
VTYHSPGQQVAYPIVRLTDRGLLIRPYLRSLEYAMAATALAFGVSAGRRDGYPGLWVGTDSDRPRKLGALGLRVERGVSYHGIALNVSTDLAAFELIDPCGMPAAEVTSIARELGWTGAAALPSTNSVERAADHFARALGLLLATRPREPVLVPA